MADIIDNSVTAGASKVEILAETFVEKPWIAVIDDGVAMDEAELIEAMRPGSRNPLEEREDHDLGRFGLGLKSASFSQCRQLTVISRKANVISAATWDLDRVAETNVWAVELEDDLSSIPAAGHLPETGTITWPTARATRCCSCTASRHGRTCGAMSCPGWKGAGD